jgi:hypothetical protein
MAMEKEAEAESGEVESEPVLVQPEASRSAGKRRKTPSRLRWGWEFQERVIEKLS